MLWPDSALSNLLLTQICVRKCPKRTWTWLTAHERERLANAAGDVAGDVADGLVPDRSDMICKNGIDPSRSSKVLATATVATSHVHGRLHAAVHVVWRNVMLEFSAFPSVLRLCMCVSILALLLVLYFYACADPARSQIQFFCPTSFA